MAHIDQKSKLVGFVAFVSEAEKVRLNYEHSAYKWVDHACALTLMPSIVHPFITHININFIQSDNIKYRCIFNA